jgi:hypothetical protein
MTRSGGHLLALLSRLWSIVFRIDRQILLNSFLAVNEGRELGPIPLMKALHNYCAKAVT